MAYNSVENKMSIILDNITNLPNNSHLDYFLMLFEIQSNFWAAHNIHTP